MSDAPTVNTPSAAYDAIEAERKLPRRLMGGTEKMRAAGEDHLPKFEGEKANTARYEKRRDNTFLTPYYSDAISQLLGRVLGKPLILHDDTPDQVKEFWQRVDGRNPGDAWVYKVAESAVGEGGDAILVDGPPMTPERFTAMNRGEDLAASGGPRFSHVKGSDLIEARVGEGPRLERARIRFSQTEPQGEWGQEEKDFVKVLRRAGWQRLDADGQPTGVKLSTWQEYEKVKSTTGGESWSDGAIYPFRPPLSAPPEVQERFAEIPLVFFAPEPAGFFRPKVVFKHLASLCEQHWRRDSEHMQAVRDAENPGLYIAGLSRQEYTEANGNADVILGGGANFLGSGPAGPPDIGFFETTGKALEHGERSVDRIEARIRLAALMPMLERASGSELATLRILDEMEVKTKAQVWALQFQAQLCEALAWAGAWMGLEVPDPVIRIPEESLRSLRPVALFTELLKLAEVLVELPEPVQEMVLEEAKRYGIVDETLNVTEVIARVVSSGEGA